MNNIYQQIINQKMKTITAEELIGYSKQYQIPLSKAQAQKIIKFLKTKNSINIFDANERKTLLKEIAKVTSPQTARELNNLFLKFVK